MIDEHGEGLSLAWCLSNHEDFTNMCIFFDRLKVLWWYFDATMGDVRHCQSVLQRTDRYKSWEANFYDLFVRGMWARLGRKNWEQRSKVTATGDAAEIYKMLRTALQKNDQVLFQENYYQLLDRLPSLSQEVYEYFQEEWSNKIHMWAY